MHKKTAIIIGAGPAGLTAALELLQKTDIKPIVFEKSEYMGGISRTVNYKGNRIDIGGHRFFSKSDKVMDWWARILPIEKRTTDQGEPLTISYQNRHRTIENSPNGIDSTKEDKVMLVRNRISRVYYGRKLFKYPISLSLDTLQKLGIVNVLQIMSSYLYIRAFPRKNIETLEDYIVNGFGSKLYKTFFKDYTEKVWGIPCNKLSAEWGAQRIKGISIRSIFAHALKSKKDNSIGQKNTQTSLIEKFLYPKYGPGQLWEEVALKIKDAGGEIITNTRVIDFKMDANQFHEVLIDDGEQQRLVKGDYFFSSMPVKDLIQCMADHVPKKIRGIARELKYRDFITVGILVHKLKIRNRDGTDVLDNWIYIQEKDVKIGRLQIFNNWSPYMVKDMDTVWLGLEYFCNEGDELWSMGKEALIEFGKNELSKLGIIDNESFIDGTVIKVPKAYPAYVGSYEFFDQIKDYVSNYDNLFLIGRNGMHRYNNQDHSMLTAMASVQCIINGSKSREHIWGINDEDEYLEEK
ncbi:NAD(P)/FAD-dependent oxidoreductase [Algoriphagus antarcticus]|uniref:UDP-galactopyranose mutase n=1 Tax=Algoriphagus antarcticus TaxID=238540 RepID=A0A3E0DRD3_9BACT|nr:NAD(P)/FAD-dependent oxidoreductase [Algoriphagus antarcticus]REG84431.1 UDP-galactopyranose mutase [Algoriphagus antarcticus]